MTSPKALVVVLAVSLLVLAWLFCGRIFLSRTKMSRVQPGMSEQAVESILGGPPGHYGWNHGPMNMSAEGGFRLTFAPDGTSNWDQVHELQWTDDYTMFEVYFDTNNVVLGVHKRVRFRRDSIAMSYCDNLLVRCRKAFGN